MVNWILIIGSVTAVAGGFLLSASLLWLAGNLFGKAAYLAWFKVKRTYHWNVMRYWLDRLEKEGSRCFQKSDKQDDKVT